MTESQNDPAGRIAHAPFGAFHIGLIALCFAIAAVDGFDTQCISFVAPTLLHEWQVSRAAFGPLFSAGLFGTMLGAFVLSAAADRIGRRPVVLACVVLFGVMSLLSATAASLELLGLYRFVGGIGLGGVVPNIIALVSEYSPHQRRATAVVAMFCGFPLGAMAGGAVSHGIIETYGWEGVFILGGVLPLVLAAVAWFALPESARFLADRNRSTELNRILSRLNAPQAAIALHHASPDRRRSLPVAVLFTEGRAAWTVSLWVLSFLGMLLTYFLINWTPLLLVAAGFPQEKAIMGVVLLNGGGVVGGLVMGRLIDRISVFGVLAVAFAAGAVCVFALGATLGVSLAVTLMMTCATGLTLFGGQMNFPGLTANHYPVHMRSTGAGWAMGFGRVGSVVGPLVGGVLVGLGMETREMLYLATLPAVLAAVLLVVMVRFYPGERTQLAAQVIADR